MKAPPSPGRAATASERPAVAAALECQHRRRVIRHQPSPCPAALAASGPFAIGSTRHASPKCGERRARQPRAQRSTQAGLAAAGTQARGAIGALVLHVGSRWERSQPARGRRPRPRSAAPRRQPAAVERGWPAPEPAARCRRVDRGTRCRTDAGAGPSRQASARSTRGPCRPRPGPAMLRAIAATAALAWSMHRACAAPRDSASSAAAPLPANRSRKRLPRRGGSPCSRMPNSASRARSLVGRVAKPSGASIRRPRWRPAMIRRLTRRRAAAARWTRARAAARPWRRPARAAPWPAPPRPSAWAGWPS